MITVVNKKNHKPTGRDVYIGRGSPLGNDWTHLPPSAIKTKFWGTTKYAPSRNEAIDNYDKDLVEKIKNKDKAVIDELERIKAMTMNGDVNLVCFCKPRSCHGDIIKRILEDESLWDNGKLL